MFKAVLKFADGEVVDDDATFETEEEAEEHGYQMLGDYGTGVTVLSMHNLENSPEADEAEVVIVELN